MQTEAAQPSAGNVGMSRVPTESNGTATAAATATAKTNSISEDEIALYDRQIRLWGMKAQEKIRNADILLINMRALGNEIAKNLVLAGIRSLTVVDSASVAEGDLGAQFLLTAVDIGSKRAVAAKAGIEKLNPRVRVGVDTDKIRSKPPLFFANFDIIIATDLDTASLDYVNRASRVNGRPFYAAGSYGLYGFLFADLIEHDFVLERAQSNVTTKVGPETRTRSVVAVAPKPGAETTVELVTKRELYSTWSLASESPLPEDVRKRPSRRRAVSPILSCLRAVWEFTDRFGMPPDSNDHGQLAQFTKMVYEKHKNLDMPSERLRSDVLRSFLQNVGAEVSPVAAVLGGQLAQDVINVLGQTQQPIQNFVIFDGGTMEANVYALHPEGPLGKGLLPLATAAGTAAGTAAAAPMIAAMHAAMGSSMGNGDVSGPNVADPTMFATSPPQGEAASRPVDATHGQKAGAW